MLKGKENLIIKIHNYPSDDLSKHAIAKRHRLSNSTLD